MQVGVLLSGSTPKSEYNWRAALKLNAIGLSHELKASLALKTGRSVFKQEARRQIPTELISHRDDDLSIQSVFIVTIQSYLALTFNTKK